MLAVAGGKGGCGKTTTALGLGLVLARSGLDPVVVDGDVDMPDVHVLAGVDTAPNTDDVAAGTPVDEVRHVPPRLPDVGIVPAGGVGGLGPALGHLSCRDGPVVVDCPAGASHEATLPFRYSDGTVIVTTDARQSLEDAAKTAGIARRFDAPPRVALVRTAADGVDSPAEYFACPVEPVPTVEKVDVHARPTFLSVCETVCRRAFPGPSRRPDRPEQAANAGTNSAPGPAENFNRW